MEANKQAGNKLMTDEKQSNESSETQASPGSFLASLFSDLRPGLYINIAAISEKDGYIGRAFSLDETLAKAVDEFCGEHSRSNLYFGPNPCHRKPIRGKAKKEDVIEDIHFVQCDIDPPGDIEDLPKWRKAQIDILRNDPPTSLVNSGNGVQAIWRLTKFVDHQTAENINRALRQRYGGDKAATDVSRLMRLPYTTNYPDKTKREKGRVEAPTDLVWLKPISTDFDNMVPTSEVEKEPTPVAYLDIENLKIPEFTKHTIKTGDRHPDDESEAYKSKSEARMAVVTVLVRAGHSDDEIKTIVSNPSLLGNKKRGEKWLDDEINRIKESIRPTRSSHVQKFVDLNWSIALLGNQFRIMRMEEDEELKRMALQALNRHTFTQIYENEFHYEWHGNPGRERRRKVQHTDLFFSDETLPRFMDVVVDPEHDGHFKNDKCEHVYNLWQGYAVKPVDHGGGKRDVVKNHCRDVLANNDEKMGDYIWKWLCWKIQNPALMPKVALGIRGEKGTGKSIGIIVPFRLLGQHFLHLMDRALTNRFNADQLDVLAILADEAFFAGNREEAQRLKGLVTETTRRIELKGVDPMTKRNMLALVFISNDDHFLPATSKERRYCITESSNKRQNNEKYFAPLFAMADGKDDEGLEDLLYWMLKEDLSDFNIRDFPRSKFLADQQKHSLDIIEEWWLGKLKLGRQHDYTIENLEPWTEIPASWRYDDFCTYCHRRGVRHIPPPEALGHALRRLLPLVDGKGVLKRTTKSLPVRTSSGSFSWIKRKQPVYVIAPLDKCREHFCEVMGSGWTIEDVSGDEEWGPVEKPKGTRADEEGHPAC